MPIEDLLFSFVVLTDTRNSRYRPAMVYETAHASGPEYKKAIEGLSDSEIEEDLEARLITQIVHRLERQDILPSDYEEGVVFKYRMSSIVKDTGKYLRFTVTKQGPRSYTLESIDDELNGPGRKFQFSLPFMLSTD